MVQRSEGWRVPAEMANYWDEVYGSPGDEGGGGYQVPRQVFALRSPRASIGARAGGVPNSMATNCYGNSAVPFVEAKIRRRRLKWTGSAMEIQRPLVEARAGETG